MGARGDFSVPDCRQLVTGLPEVLNAESIGRPKLLPVGRVCCAPLEASRPAACGDDNYDCAIVRPPGASTTKFVIASRSYFSQNVHSGQHPDGWSTLLNQLCLRSSLATCLGPNVAPDDPYGNWRITVGKSTINLSRIDWAGSNGAFASGTRGNPYQQVVGTPTIMGDQFGFQTLVTGLPPGLAYYPQSDQIMGTLSAVPGKYTVTIKLVNGTGTTTLSIGTRTITILAVPNIWTTSLGSSPIGKPYSGQLFIDTGGPLSATTITVKGLPNGLAYNPGQADDRRHPHHRRHLPDHHHREQRRRHCHQDGSPGGETEVVNQLQGA